MEEYAFRIFDLPGNFILADGGGLRGEEIRQATRIVDGRHVAGFNRGVDVKLAPDTAYAARDRTGQRQQPDYLLINQRGAEGKQFSSD